MRGKTKIKLKMEVEVELDFEFDPIFREVSIVSANIPECQVSPRKVYASMVSGNYNELDSRVQKELKDKFYEETGKFISEHISSFPEEEVRSVPCEYAEWARIMKAFKGGALPMTLIGQAVNGLGILIEPVLCRTPTVYLWPRDPGGLLASEPFRERMYAAKAQNVEDQNDGSIKVTWKQYG
jgi:hypothetical protein